MIIKLVFAVFFCLQGVFSFDPLQYKFNEAFSFGVATSAYQVEGAWNVSGKGVSLWDYITHNTDTIVDGSNGDVACNSYYKIDDDIKLLKEMGVSHYRFSIAWTRILPTGMINEVNWEGVAYYDELITKLLEAEIEPWVTIYHFDHPYSIDLIGGWFQPEISHYIADYADLLFYIFGNRVKTWITINEPWSICINGIAGSNNLIPIGTAEYMCGQNILKAHAAIYSVYNKKYRAIQKGKLSMAFSLQAYIPATDKIEDVEAAERLNQFAFGWFVHPLVFGNYPQIMIDTIAYYSQEQGFTKSRLPALTLSDLFMLKNAYDYIGLNNYDTFLISAANGTISKNPTYQNDFGADVVAPPWNTSYSIYMKSKGLGVILKWIKDTYNNPEIRIMEQGYPESNINLMDMDRHNYVLASMEQVLRSINEDEVKVTGYTFWSFLDNFEWTSGYSKRYGLNYVDFNNPDRPRIPRVSAVTYAFIAKNKSLQGLL